MELACFSKFTNHVGEIKLINSCAIFLCTKLGVGSWKWVHDTPFALCVYMCVCVCVFVCMCVCCVCGEDQTTTHYFLQCIGQFAYHQPDVLIDCTHVCNFFSFSKNFCKIVSF